MRNRSGVNIWIVGCDVCPLLVYSVTFTDAHSVVKKVLHPSLLSSMPTSTNLKLMISQVVTTALIQRAPPPPLRLTPQSLVTPRGQTALLETLSALTRTKVRPALERPQSHHTGNSASRKRKAQRVRQDLRKLGWPRLQARCTLKLNLRTWT